MKSDLEMYFYVQSEFELPRNELVRKDLQSSLCSSDFKGVELFFSDCRGFKVRRFQNVWSKKCRGL